MSYPDPVYFPLYLYLSLQLSHFLLSNSSMFLKVCKWNQAKVLLLFKKLVGMFLNESVLFSIFVPCIFIRGSRRQCNLPSINFLLVSVHVGMGNFWWGRVVDDIYPLSLITCCVVSETFFFLNLSIRPKNEFRLSILCCTKIIYFNFMQLWTL